MQIGKVWIYRLLFVCNFVCVCVCTVENFSAENKASCVKFCTVVHRRSRQDISHFGKLCSTKAKNRTNRPARTCSNVMLLGFVTDIAIKFARRVDVGSARVDICQSPLTDVLVCLYGYGFLRRG